MPRKKIQLVKKKCEKVVFGIRFGIFSEFDCADQKNNCNFHRNDRFTYRGDKL